MQALLSVFKELKKLSIAELSYTSPARRMLQVIALFPEQLLEVFARVLAALVGVMHKLRGFATAPHGHHQRVGLWLACFSGHYRKVTVAFSN